MTWVITFDREKQLLLVKAEGNVRGIRLRKMTEELRDAVRLHGARGVLLDYRKTNFQLEPYEIFERPKVLIEVGFPGDARVAVLFSTLDENTQFLENVYRNKNFPVRVFEDEASAFKWLEDRR